MAGAAAGEAQPRGGESKPLSCADAQTDPRRHPAGRAVYGCRRWPEGLNKLRRPCTLEKLPRSSLVATQTISLGACLAAGDGVRVSFENSTVCRACFSGFVPVLFLFFCQGFVGEFDPGSGRTLAACLTHASRAVRPFRGYTSGERVSNTWVTCPLLWDKPGKLGLIPDRTSCCMVWG
jgi:hypothetical protein